MIHLTRINRSELVLNSDLIEYIETTPDTVVSLTNGVKLLVRESPEVIVDRVIGFRQGILRGLSKETVNAGTSVLSFPGPKPVRSKNADQPEDEE